MIKAHLDPSDRPVAHLLSLGSVLTVLDVGVASLVQATPSWWRLLLVPLVALPAITLRHHARHLAVPEDPWTIVPPMPRVVPAPGYDLEATRALRYGWVDADGPRAA